MSLNDPLLTVQEAATQLRVSKSYLYQIINQHKIAHHQFGRRILFSQRHIDEYLRENEIGRAGT